MAKTQKPAGQKQAARLSAFLLVFAGWFATAALGACVPQAPGSHEIHFNADAPGLSASYATGAGGADSECCISSLNGLQYPAFLKGPSPADPKPAALLDVYVAPLAAPTPGVRVVSGDTDAQFDHPPFYLLYGRLLIASFS